jgi:hypothetical protein
MTLWIEALCLHEWCRLSEAVQPRAGVDRGAIYRLLTARPDNRRPLTRERHQIDLLLPEGMTFTCLGTPSLTLCGYTSCRRVLRTPR